MPIFPAFVSTERLVRSPANQPRALFMETHLGRMAIPAKHHLRLARIAPAILARHLGLEGSALLPPHFGRGQLEIFQVTSL